MRSVPQRLAEFEALISTLSRAAAPQALHPDLPFARGTAALWLGGIDSEVWLSHLKVIVIA